MSDAYTPPQDDAKTPLVSETTKYWREIERYEKAMSTWKEQGEEIVKLYLDEDREITSKVRKFALLWSNVETLKPAVYAKTPNVVCSRRFKDRDPVGRVAAEILERCANTTLDLYHADEVFKHVRDDRLLPGRGQAWVRYEAKFNTVPAKGEEGQEGYEASYDKLAGEKACIDYVHWSDFGHNVAKTWADVWLVWRRVYKDKDEVTQRFGKDIAGKLAYTAKPSEEKTEGAAPRAVIYELWDKRANRTIWMAKEQTDFLEDPSPPPLNFHDFFPCPEPCYASKTSKSLIPTPDYRYYRDQAKEINDLTQKIDSLTGWLILKGFVPSGPSSEGGDAVNKLVETLESQLNNSTVLIPVESWAGFTEKGGASKLIDWLPLDKVLQALKGAIEAREQLIQDVYQITGISDILRGQSDPNETLGAQELKAQNGSRRVRNAKDEIARFCRDVAALVCEVIAEQFQPSTIEAMSGAKYVPAPPVQPGMPGMAPQAMMAQPAPQAGQVPGEQSPSGITFGDDVLALLRNDRLRGFRIDIETDSTIQPDEDAEKQRRIEFLDAVGGFLEKGAAILPVMPELAPMASEMLMFTARGFRAGRNLEDVIEKSLQALVQRTSQPQQDPKQIQAQQEMAQSKQLHEQKMAQGAQQMQFDQAKHAQEMQQSQIEFEQTLAQKTQAANESMALKRQAAAAKPAPKANGKAAPVAAGSSEHPDITEALEGIGTMLGQGMQAIAQASNTLAQAAGAIAQSHSVPMKITKQPDGSFVKEPVTVN
jgi:hypothetical protein